MTQYIDKAAIVAEIEKRKTNIKEYCVRKGHDRRFDVVPEQLAQILSFLDTLEAKEVDLDKEISEYFVEHSDEFFSDKYKLIAKHFFELGLKAQKEQMIAKAIDGYVIEDIEEGNGDFLLSTDYISKELGFKDKEKVKVIVIKAD